MRFETCETNLGMDGEFLISFSDHPPNRLYAHSFDRGHLDPRYFVRPETGTTFPLGTDGRASTWEMRISPSCSVENIVKDIGRKVLLASTLTKPYFRKMILCDNHEPIGSHIWINKSISSAFERRIYDMALGVTANLFTTRESLHRRWERGYGQFTNRESDTWRQADNGAPNLTEYRVPPSFWRTPDHARVIFNIAACLANSDIKSLIPPDMFGNEWLNAMFPSHIAGEVTQEGPNRMRSWLVNDFSSSKIVDSIPGLKEAIQDAVEISYGKIDSYCNIEKWEEFLKPEERVVCTETVREITSLGEYLQKRTSNLMGRLSNQYKSKGYIWEGDLLVDALGEKERPEIPEESDGDSDGGDNEIYEPPDDDQEVE